jgi:competence ComEA-like helix-hairpin-helix protein
MTVRLHRQTNLIRFLILLMLLAPSLSSCAQRARERNLTNGLANPIDSPQAFQSNQPQRININTASAEELEKLPGIGKALAARIIEHREKYGPFRRPEHLIIVRGISDKRFRTLRNLITAE